MEDRYSFGYRRYGHIDDMPADERMLAYRAKEACAGSYSPYSGYKVGAAALLASGAVITSSNQESEVFPAGICAEHGLIVNWQANHAGDPIVALAVASVSGGGECYPCGICRQVMVDIEKRQGASFRVVMCGPDSAVVVEASRYLLPFNFSLVQ